MNTDKKESKLEIFLGKENFKLAQNSDIIKFYRLEYHQELIKSEIPHYKISVEITVNKDSSEKIRAILLDESNYIWDRDNKIEPKYPILIIFTTGKKQLKILVDFKNQIVAIVGKDSFKVNKKTNIISTILD